MGLRGLDDFYLFYGSLYIIILNLNSIIMVIKKIVLVELFFIKFKYIYGYFFLGNNISFFCFGFENFWICVWFLLNFYMYCVYV